MCTASSCSGTSAGSRELSTDTREADCARGVCIKKAWRRVAGRQRRRSRFRRCRVGVTSGTISQVHQHEESHGAVQQNEDETAIELTSNKRRDKPRRRGSSLLVPTLSRRDGVSAPTETAGACLSLGSLFGASQVNFFTCYLLACCR